MDIDFHYYITYILARKGGYSESDASTIAYACEYTDDNNDKYRVTLDDGTVYQNYISQTLNILHPKNKLVRIYSCFHFFPGDYLSDEVRRADGSFHLFNTTPTSFAAKAMFTNALNTDNLYRIGIAAHCFADTWSHQNFVGFKHAFNGGKGLLSKIMPKIGHVHFGYQPDVPALKWRDTRLLGKGVEVRNKVRFLAAAKSMFVAFAERKELTDIKSLWDRLAQELSRAIGNESSSMERCLKRQDTRIAAYRDICPDIPEYDANSWREDALEPVAGRWRSFCDRFWKWSSAAPKAGPYIQAYWPKQCRIRAFRAKPEFDRSHWYKFQEAVKEHQAVVMDLLRERYEQIGAAMQDLL